MDLQSFRNQIAQLQACLSEITAQIADGAAVDYESLSSELAPLVNQLNHALASSRLPLENLTPGQFQSILDAVSAGVLVYDHPQIIRYVNQKAIQYIGYDPTGETRNGYMQKVQLTDWSGNPLSIHDRPANLVWEGRLARDVPMMITNVNGQVYQVLVTAIPLFQEDQFSGAVVIWNDVTRLEQAAVEIRRREAQLRESEARFRVALANTSIFVYTLDRDLRYTWLYTPHNNEAAQRALGKRNDEIVTDADMHGLEALKRQVIETGIGFRKEISVMLHGEQRVFDMTFEPLRDANGQIIGLTGASMDITKQRNLEARRDEFAARVELHQRVTEQRERNLLLFAQTIHDGPLQGMISLITDIQLMRDLLPDDQASEVLNEVETRAKNLADQLRLVCNTLNPPSPTRFGLKRAILAHAQDLQTRYPEIQFKLSLMEDILKLPDLLCDALYRIYREAIKNVLQHTHASMVSIQLIFYSNMIRLEIEDNGSGFRPPVNWLELIQDRHYGLVSMREQAESIGAQFTLTSAPGSGTRVSVIVPYSD